MGERPVDELRAELRNLGYLTHGIGRWFALDPWSSRTFWAELVAVCGKASLLASFFAMLPLAVIMSLRNQPLQSPSVALLGAIYFVTSFAAIFALLVLIALVLRTRPALAIDSPAALTGMSLGLAILVALGILVWWSGFDSVPSWSEVGAGGTLIILFVVVAALVFSAALLSFSIHEAKKIPLVAQKDRTVLLSVVALMAALVIVGWVARTSRSMVAAAPVQVVVASSTARVALLAVDGMTWDLFAAQRPADLGLAFATPLTPYRATHSSAERWATLGTGTPPSAHQVRAIDGIRLAGSSRVLQSVSRRDPALGRVAVSAGFARRIPLPPTVRRRHYVWEILGARGVRSAAVNWWATDDEATPNLTSVSQASVFSAASEEPGDATKLALSIDRTALERAEELVHGSGAPPFVSVYLPAIDIVLNRLDLDQSARTAASIRAATEVFAAARRLRSAGYEIILVGMPGEGSEANAVLASTIGASSPPTLDSVAPTLLAVMGFPPSEEMAPGLFLQPATQASRIPTYGDRDAPSERAPPSAEYWESLKSLGYIR